MRLSRFAERYEESFDDVEAFVLLAANERGEKFHIFAGPEESIGELLVHGVTRWPMAIPYEEETVVLLEKLLADAPPLQLDAERRSSEVFRAAALLREACDEVGSPLCIGWGAEKIVVSDTEHFPYLVVEGIETLLLFVMHDGKRWILQNGFDFQKALLAFYAVEQFWGSEMRDLFEDVLLGLDREMFHQMAQALQGVQPGQIVRIEAEEQDPDAEEDEA